MGRSKVKKMLSVTKGLLRRLAVLDNISTPNLDLFLGCPLAGEAAEVQLAFSAIAELNAALARKYREDFANPQFTSSLKELRRVAACLKSGQVPK